MQTLNNSSNKQPLKAVSNNHNKQPEIVTANNKQSTNRHAAKSKKHIQKHLQIGMQQKERSIFNNKQQQQQRVATKSHKQYSV